MELAIAAKAGAALEAYKSFFEKQGVQLLHVSSLSELFQSLPTSVISGFIIDIHLVLKATEMEKGMLQVLEGIFPNVRTNWHPPEGFRALYKDSQQSGEENLFAFLEDCRNFKPRALRKDRREAINFNVLFWPSEATETAAHRAYTSDVSPGGIFVCTCHPPPEGQVVWVKLLELDDQPCQLLVRRSLAWGAARRVPGFGGSFVEMSKDLGKKLEAALRNSGQTAPQPGKGRDLAASGPQQEGAGLV